MLSTFTAGIALTLLCFAVVPRKYRSEAKVLVRIGRESITLDPTATTGQFVGVVDSRDSELHAVEELVTSRALAEKIVEQFGARVILERKSNGKPFGERLTWLDGYNLNPLRVYSVHDKAVNALQNNLTVSAWKKSNVLTISYEAEDPQVAHDVLQALLTTAREEHARVHRTTGSHQFFESQRELLARDLREQEQRLREFKDDHGLASLVSQRDGQISMITALQGDFLRAGAELNGVLAEIVLRRKQLRDQPSQIVTEQITGQPQTARQTLRERLFELELREQELGSRLTKDAPQLIQIRAQIDEANRIIGEEQIGMETKKGISQTYQAAELALQEREAQLAAASARCAALDSKLTEANAELKHLNAAELELTQMEREIELVRVNYRKYSENLEQVRIDHELEAAKISSLNLMQAPSMSRTPVSPQPMVTLTLGTCASIIASIGVALAFPRRLRRRRTITQPSVENSHEVSPRSLRPRRSEVAAVKPP